MANPQNFLIAGNDEHGQNPPTAGKRTPVMPYIGRSIYENEFNRPAKQRFLAACARLGFRVFDVKPELQDISISERVRRVNARGCNFVLTFGYNASQDPNFNAANGSQVFYATNNPYPSASRTVSVYIADNIGNTGVVRNRGAAVLSGVGMLSSVRCAAALAEPGFMTNFREAKLMLDPDFQQLAAEASARALCTYYGVTYTPQASGVSYPTIRRGDRGQYVLYLQWMLTVYGYAPGHPAPRKQGHLRSVSATETFVQTLPRGHAGRHLRSEHTCAGARISDRKRARRRWYRRSAHLGKGFRHQSGASPAPVKTHFRPGYSLVQLPRTCPAFPAW